MARCAPPQGRWNGVGHMTLEQVREALPRRERPRERVLGCTPLNVYGNGELSRADFERWFLSLIEREGAGWWALCDYSLTLDGVDRGGPCLFYTWDLTTAHRYTAQIIRQRIERLRNGEELGAPVWVLVDSPDDLPLVKWRDIERQGKALGVNLVTFTDKPSRNWSGYTLDLGGAFELSAGLYDLQLYDERGQILSDDVHAEPLTAVDITERRDAWPLPPLHRLKALT